jgi:hypothetical protein
LGTVTAEKDYNSYFVSGDASFVKLENENKGLAKLSAFETKIKIEGLNGLQKVAFVVSTSDKSSQVSLVQPGLYKVGALAEFVQNEVKYEDTPINNFNMHEVYRDSAGLYGFRGSEFAKYAMENPIRNLNKDQAAWVAIHCGASEKDVDALFSLTKAASYTFSNEISCPESLETLEKEIEKVASSKNKDATPLYNKNFTKLAAAMPDKTSVDAILSLNMLKRRNLEDYVALIPSYEMVLGELCKLLVSVRLGLSAVDVDSVKMAVESLTEVLLQLENVQAQLGK